MARVLIEGNLCERYLHRWAPKQPNTPELKNCPKCKNPYWNKPRMTPARGNPAWLKNNSRQAVA